MICSTPHIGQGAWKCHILRLKALLSGQKVSAKLVLCWLLIGKGDGACGRIFGFTCLAAGEDWGDMSIQRMEQSSKGWLARQSKEFDSSEAVTLLLASFDVYWGRRKRTFFGRGRRSRRVEPCISCSRLNRGEVFLQFLLLLHWSNLIFIIPLLFYSLLPHSFPPSKRRRKVTAIP